MNKIEHVLRKNEMAEKTDFSMFPDSKFTVLKEALIQYYETYQSSWVDGNKRNHFVIVNDSSVRLNSTTNQALLHNQYSSFVFVQMFFEIYFLAILEPISPLIIYDNTIKNNKITDTLIRNEYSLSKNVEKRTIEFSKVLDRFKNLVENNSKLPSNFQVPEEYHFLYSHSDTIKTVLNYRNSIMHRGSGVLSEYFFDWFWVNHLLPLIHKIILKEDKNSVILRTISCGIDLMSEFEQTPLPKDYSTFSSYKALEKNLHKICHLKALGRASYKNKLYVAKGFRDSNNEYIKKLNNEKIESENNKAQLFQQHLQYPKPYVCPCCGCSTLIPNTISTLLNHMQEYEKVACTQCDYQVSRWNNEPKEFKILDETIFKVK